MNSTTTLIVMRHAQAGEARAGAGDFARELTPQGRDDARCMGQWLEANTAALTRVVSSTALRAAQTVEAAFSQSTHPPQLIWEPSLYLADAAVLLETVEWTRSVPSIIVGHNPGLEDFLQWLVADPGAIALPPAALVVVNFPSDIDRVTQGVGRILTKMAPDQLTGG